MPSNRQQYYDTVLEEQERALAFLTDAGTAWQVPVSLRDKVEEDGRLTAFFGDTVVFPLEADGMREVAELQEVLHAAHPQLWAERLHPATLHMTLHDLTASTHPDNDWEPRMQHCAAIFGRLPRGRVTVQASAVYPSCNVSVVLGVVPAEERDYRLLSDAYGLFDEIARVSYWPRFHVTLAYFAPRPLSSEERHALHVTLRGMQPLGLSLSVDLQSLCYQRFTSMNAYQTVLTAGR